MNYFNSVYIDELFLLRYYDLNSFISDVLCVLQRWVVLRPGNGAIPFKNCGK